MRKSYLLLLVIYIICIQQAICQFSGIDSSRVKVYPLSVNSSNNEFAPFIFKNQFYYCSNGKVGILPYYSEITGEPLNNIVTSSIISDNKFGSPKILLKINQSKTNQGPFTISPDGTRIYFTASGIEKEGYTTVKKPFLKIFTSKLVNGEWVGIEEFPYNQKKSSVAHPCVSADGKVFIFASNMPGGYGGSDLYYCVLNDSVWSRPKNLGPKVNSKGNEYFPYLNKENILFFSSDFHPGNGKLDIFYSKMVDSIWQKPRNAGKPINSEFDDFSYIEDPSGMTGYFSSNRQTGKDDDIFRFEKTGPTCDTLNPNPYCYTFFESGTLDKDNLPLMYEWDFGDGKRQRGLEASHCFEFPGHYFINLNIIDTVTNKVYFNEASYMMEVEPIDKPHYSFSLEPKKEGILASFNAKKTNLNDCSVSEYYWDFGDGETGVGLEASHLYDTPDNYMVTLLIQGKTNTGTDCMQCVNSNVSIAPKPNEKIMVQDTSSHISDIAHTLHSTKGKKDLVFKVQVTSSKQPLTIDSVNFKGLKDVVEYKDEDQRYGYVVGQEDDLADAYPLYVDIKEKGFEDAKVVAFRNGKIISGNDTTIFSKKTNTQVFTHISGRILNRYGDPLKAEINLENLTSGKIISKIISDSLSGKFHIILPNEEIYGYYAELPGYYSISNYIDLRKEIRNLEIKKNIEMIGLADLNDENISIRLNNIFFELNEFKLKKESYPELNRLARLLAKQTNVKIEISGHTDNTGGSETNLLLSQKRADAVKDYLMYSGINKSSIISKGYGDSKPLVSNSSERGRYLNRRVEFRLFFD